MRVFLVGGTEFLGTYLIPKLLENGHKITVLTHNEKKISRLETLPVSVMGCDIHRHARSETREIVS